METWMQHLDSNDLHVEKARREFHKNTTSCFELILDATHNKTAVVWPLTSNLRNHPSKTNQTC